MSLKKIISITFFNLIVLIFFLGFSVRSQSLPPITINNNSKYSGNPEGKVDLRLSLNGAEEMMISNHEDFKDSKWEKFVSFKEWFLKNEDGERTVYVKFKDRLNKESKTFSSSIILDRQPPVETKFLINNDLKFVTNFLRQVQLTFHAKDAAFIMVANDSLFSAARWMPYTTNISNWALTGNEGVKTIYAKFKDKADNESQIVKDEIILDLQPPTVISFQVNEGDKLTNNERVKLTILAQDASEIWIKESNAKWQPFKEKIDLTLEGNDGIKLISFKLRDEAGNSSNFFNTQISLDRNSPKAARVIINNNKPFTSDPSKKVILNLYAQEAVELMISEDSLFSDSKWTNYQPMINWTLSEADGKKIIYARFKDVAGNITPTIKDEIILDRSSPEGGTLIINGGQSVTNKTAITIELSAPEAHQMMISSNESFLGALWEGFLSEKKISLQGADGEKWVFVKYKDAAGNVSKPISASITLDRLPPTEGGLKINNAIGYSTDAEGKVLLSITAKGAAEMMVSNTNDFKGAIWQPFKDTLNWKITGSDGMKVVGVKFRDAAGNVSKVAIAKVKLARSATIKGNFTINSDSVITKNPYKRVDLNISAQGAKDMLISNYEDFKGAAWEEYKTHRIWTLSEGDGEKTVYLKFRGFVGNESKVYSDKIQMDRSAPQNCRILINNDSLFTINRNNQVKLTLRASNATKMMISNNPVFQGAHWESYKTSKGWVLDSEEGVKTVYARFKDEVGNESEIVSDHILLDKTAPLKATLKINNGADFTNNPRKAVTLVFAAQGAVQMRISNSPNIESADWEKISNKKLNWILPGEDGEKRVYVQYKDEGENVSAVVFDKIVLDRTPPKNCKFSINNDSLFTHNSAGDVRLYISGEDVSSILISNRLDFFGARWETFKTYKSHWILDGEDGEKTVYMAFKDAAGNIYKDTLSRKIILDRTPPKDISVSVKGERVSNKKVVLHLKAKEADMMEIRSDKEVESEWEAFKESKEWTFPEDGDDERNIWLRFRDKAGNVTPLLPVFQNQ